MRRIHALALLSMVALAACSTPAPATPSPSPAASSAGPSSSASAPASSGPAIFGTGYTIALPKGWKDATAKFKKLQPMIDAAANDPKDGKDGFGDNVNVVAQAQAEQPLDAIKTQLKAQLESAGSTDVTFKDNLQLDGRPAIQIWSHPKVAPKAWSIQFLSFNNGRGYVLTVTTNRSPAKAEALGQQIVAAWKWTA